MCTFFTLLTYAEFKRENKSKSLIEKIKEKNLVLNIVYTKDAYTEISVHQKMREKF